MKKTNKRKKKTSFNRMLHNLKSNEFYNMCQGKVN